MYNTAITFTVSSTTGALSNPSPESGVQLTPVLANQVSSAYSTDPQVDKVDYYRLDDNLKQLHICRDWSGMTVLVEL